MRGALLAGGEHPGTLLVEKSAPPDRVAEHKKLIEAALAEIEQIRAVMARKHPVPTGTSASG
jgi:hypothetical protein